MLSVLAPTGPRVVGTDLTGRMAANGPNGRKAAGTDPTARTLAARDRNGQKGAGTGRTGLTRAARALIAPTSAPRPRIGPRRAVNALVGRKGAGLGRTGPVLAADARIVPKGDGTAQTGRTLAARVPDAPTAAGTGPDRPDGWNRPDRPRPGWNNDRERERLRREFRQRFDAERWRRDFYRNHRADWWRNDNRFRGYDGFRAGFYFAPGWGYYSVPRSYWGRNWSVGQYLPEAFWRYQLQDWRTYGLGYPPAGTRWVSVDNSLYLIDEYDGYIVDVVRDAWRW